MVELERLFLDMESLPSLSSLQAALINQDLEAEVKTNTTNNQQTNTDKHKHIE